VVSCDPARLGKAGKVGVEWHSGAWVGLARHGTAGQARFVGVWCGAARIGSLRQAGIGGFRFVRAGSGLFRQARFVAACSGSFGQGQAGKFRLGGARCGSVR